MIKYDKLFALLEANGYNSTKIKETGLLGQGTFTRLKRGEGGLDNRSIDRICRVFGVQPGDIMEYIPDKSCNGGNHSG
jgi:DNA-binding Xre family transcriptional regulator